MVMFLGGGGQIPQSKCPVAGWATLPAACRFQRREWTSVTAVKEVTEVRRSRRTHKHTSTVGDVAQNYIRYSPTVENNFRVILAGKVGRLSRFWGHIGKRKYCDSVNTFDRPILGCYTTWRADPHTTSSDLENILRFII